MSSFDEGRKFHNATAEAAMQSIASLKSRRDQALAAIRSETSGLLVGEDDPKNRDGDATLHINVKDAASNTHIAIIGISHGEFNVYTAGGNYVPQEDTASVEGMLAGLGFIYEKYVGEK